MSKRLYILRHAQAMNAIGQTDKQRPLSPKGLKDACALAHAMEVKGYLPDICVYSSALRTTQTFEILSKTMNASILSQGIDALYNAPAPLILSSLEMIDEAYDSALIIAHNPGIHEFALWLANKEHNIHLDRLKSDYTPATLCVFDCLVDLWSEISTGRNMLMDFMDPLDYNAPARPTRWM